MPKDKLQRTLERVVDTLKHDNPPSIEDVEFLRGVFQSGPLLREMRLARYCLKYDLLPQEGWKSMSERIEEALED